MEPEKKYPVEARGDGVALGDAWWVFAHTDNKKRFRDLQQAASSGDRAPHMGFRHALEDEIVGRLSTGELQAFGIEYGSIGEPIAIPKTYFWKGAEIDFDNDTVTALGKKFGQVTVCGDRNPTAHGLPDLTPIDLPQILTELRALSKVSVARGLRPNPNVRPTPNKTAARALPSEPASRRIIISGPRRGRPSKTDEIEQAIDILLKDGIDLAAMPRLRAYKAIRKCAQADLKSNTTIGFSDPVIQRALFRRFRERR